MNNSTIHEYCYDIFEAFEDPLEEYNNDDKPVEELLSDILQTPCYEAMCMLNEQKAFNPERMYNYYHLRPLDYSNEGFDWIEMSAEFTIGDYIAMVEKLSNNNNQLAIGPGWTGVGDFGNYLAALSNQFFPAKVILGLTVERYLGLFGAKGIKINLNKRYIDYTDDSTVSELLNRYLKMINKGYLPVVEYPFFSWYKPMLEDLYDCIRQLLVVPLYMVYPEYINFNKAHKKIESFIKDDLQANTNPMQQQCSATDSMMERV